MATSFYEKFDISPQFGFLADCTVEIPSDFDMFAEIIANLENMDGVHFRKLVDALPALNHPQEFYVNLANKQTRAVQRKVYSTFTFIAQKYVRCLGKDHQLATIPFEIGLIWYHCAEKFKLPIVTTYTAVVLANWRLTDPTKPPSLENFDAIHAISGKTDEAWFYRIHVSIEHVGAQVLQQMYDIEETTQTVESTLAFLITLHRVLREIRDLIIQMRTGCDPDNYWNYVRIFLGGYTPKNGLPNGLNIKDTPIKDIMFDGGSAAQSSLIQSFDAFLQVEHPSDKSLNFLMLQRSYMPEAHVQYLEALGQHRSIRDIVVAYNDEELTSQYNTVMMAFGKFRAAHYGLVYEYVIQFTNAARMAEEAGDLESAARINRNNIHGEGGSGGTVHRMLDNYRQDTIKTRIHHVHPDEA
jgi:indoleamine 2,3-dioxygenase